MKLMFDDLHARMPWEDIDNVVFDVGNVLLLYSPDKLMHDLLPGQEALYPALMHQVFLSPYWTEMDRGMMTPEEAIAPMGSGHPELEDAVRTLMLNWRDLKDVIAEGVATLRKCKEMGKKVYVLSNYNDQAFAYIRTKYDFWDLVDGFVISGQEHLVKPDPAIYHVLEKRFDVTPERTLFIDDSHVNIEAAMHCGWQGIHYHQPGQLSAFFDLKA